jgi:Probable lipoprotein LpqN
VTVGRWAGVVALVAIAAAGCGPKPPDYQSIWSTTTTTTTTAKPEASEPISKYFANAGIDAEAVEAAKLTDLTVTMPRPPGWEQYSNPQLAPGQQVITDRSGYPTASLLTYRLGGTLNVAEALSHADAEAELSTNFKKLNGSKDNYEGFPSSMIEGTYDLNGQRMQTYSRIVIPTGTSPKPGTPGSQYLVQLTVTGFANDAVKEGPDVEAIIKGFTVAAKK